MDGVQTLARIMRFPRTVVMGEFPLNVVKQKATYEAPRWGLDYIFFPKKNKCPPFLGLLTFETNDCKDQDGSPFTPISCRIALTRKPPRAADRLDA